MIFVVPGGDSHPHHKAFLQAERDRKVDLTKLGRGGFRDWKDGLKGSLGDGYTTETITMPCKENARYDAWEIRFSKYVPAFTSDTILIGNSLGGAFLAKFLDQNVLPQPVAATFLIAASFPTRSRSTFKIRADLKTLAQQAGAVFLYHSQDDKVVPYSHVEEYVKRLPDATVRRFTSYGHFACEKIPELIEDIRSLDFAPL